MSKTNIKDIFDTWERVDRRYNISPNPTYGQATTVAGTLTGAPLGVQTALGVGRTLDEYFPKTGGTNPPLRGLKRSREITKDFSPLGTQTPKRHMSRPVRSHLPYKLAPNVGLRGRKPIPISTNMAYSTPQLRSFYHRGGYKRKTFKRRGRKYYKRRAKNSFKLVRNQLVQHRKFAFLIKIPMLAASGENDDIGNEVTTSGSGSLSSLSWSQAFLQANTVIDKDIARNGSELPRMGFAAMARRGEGSTTTGHSSWDQGSNPRYVTGIWKHVLGETGTLPVGYSNYKFMRINHVEIRIKNKRKTAPEGNDQMQIDTNLDGTANEVQLPSDRDKVMLYWIFPQDYWETTVDFALHNPSEFKVKAGKNKGCLDDTKPIVIKFKPRAHSVIEHVSAGAGTVDTNIFKHDNTWYPCVTEAANALPALYGPVFMLDFGRPAAAGLTESTGATPNLMVFSPYNDDMATNLDHMDLKDLLVEQYFHYEFKNRDTLNTL